MFHLKQISELLKTEFLPQASWILSTIFQVSNLSTFLHTNFSYERRFSSYVFALLKNLYKKRVRIKLMKLTTGVKFINFFTQAFFVQKSLAQLFSNYSLALYFFAKRILVQMLLIKSWWNWLQVSISSTF